MTNTIPYIAPMESMKLKLDHDAKLTEVDSRKHATGLGTKGGFFAGEGQLIPSKFGQFLKKRGLQGRDTHSSNPELSASLLDQSANDF